MLDLTNDRNIEAEYGVIGSICLDNACYDKIANKIDASDFTIPLCSKLYKSIDKCIRSGKPWDAATAPELLGGDKSVTQQFIIDCITTTLTPANVDTHATIVHNNAMMRSLKTKLDETMTVAGNPQELASTAAGICRDFLESASNKKLIPLSEAIGKVYKSQTEKNDDKRINTGFPLLDTMLKGLHPGNLCVVGARAGVGKTAFVLDVARTAAAKGRVLIYSYEMENDEIAERMLARAGEIPLDGFIDRNLDREQMKRFGMAASWLGKFPININDNASTKITDIRNDARMFDDLGLIIVDYLQLMPVHSKRERRDLEIGELTRGLKLLAKELKVPIIALSQLNRKIDNSKEPTMSELRESGNIEQDANQIILIWDADEDKHIVGVKIGKNRRGKKGKVFMEFTGEFMRYMELSNYTPLKRKNKGYDDVYGEDDD